MLTLFRTGHLNCAVVADGMVFDVSGDYATVMGSGHLEVVSVNERSLVACCQCFGMRAFSVRATRSPLPCTRPLALSPQTE
jgi:hypothetical protein